MNPYRIAISTVALFYLCAGTTIVHSETTSLPTNPIVCDEHQISMRVLSLKRMSPGELSIDVQYENLSNLPYKLNAAGLVALIDSDGEKWKSREGGGNLSRQGELVSGIKRNIQYVFMKQKGGQDVTAASFVHKVRVWGNGGLLGMCQFDVKNIPIAST